MAVAALVAMAAAVVTAVVRKRQRSGQLNKRPQNKQSVMLRKMMT
jgi:hypothetical protein